MYCPNCRITFPEADRCPVCGGKKVRASLPEDICRKLPAIIKEVMDSEK